MVRFKEFYREPEAVFWVYGFPILLMIGLGLAFGGDREEALRVIVVGEGARAESTCETLNAASIEAELASREDATRAYDSGRVDLVVQLEGEGYRLLREPTRPQASFASVKVADVLQRAAGRVDAISVEETTGELTSTTYVEWLIPGLLGMNIMNGGLWGLGFVTVDLRMRKLLKRFVATPMRKSHFLLALMVSRLVFLGTEMVSILAIGCFVLGLDIRGNVLSALTLMVAGGFCFAGIGLLTSCRAEKIEVISGLINLIMMPMWLCSGVFFASERFPEYLQPFVQALPLTQLNNALRSVILDGETLASQWLPLAVLVGVGLLTFSAALRWFKWS